MSKSKAERHLVFGDAYMKSGLSKHAFYLYNSALGNFEKASDVEGQRLALKKMVAAAEAWQNRGMAEKCRRLLEELKG